MKENLSQKYDNLYSSEKVVFKAGKPEEFVTKIPNYVTGGEVLDIGGGEGRNAIYLAEKGYEVEVIDISKVGLEKIQNIAKEKKLNLKTQMADIQSEHIKKSYKIIVSSFMLHHLLRTNALELINEIKSHTNKGGINVITAFTENGDFFKKDTSTNLFYLKHNELKNIYKNWNIKDYKEIETAAYAKNEDGTNKKNVSVFIIAQKKES